MYSKNLMRATAIASAAILVAGLTACGKQEAVDEPQAVEIESTTEASVDTTIEEEVEKAVEGVSVEETVPETVEETAPETVEEQAPTDELPIEDDQSGEYFDALSTDESLAVEEVEVDSEANNSPNNALAVTTTKYAEEKILYTKSACNVRIQPDKKSDLVTSLPQGWEVVVSGETDNGWYEIKMDGAYFYIKASLLTSTKPTQQATNPPKEETNQQAQSQSQSSQSSQPASEPQPTPAEEQAWLDSLGDESDTMDSDFSNNTGSDGSSFAGIDFN